MPHNELARPQTRRKRKFVNKALIKWVLLFAASVYLIVEFNPVFRYFRAPAVSMAPAIPLGSKFVVNRTSYGYSAHSFDWFPLPIKNRWPLSKPKRGDIAVFRARIASKYVLDVKRVIGLPGETIQMKAGRLYIDGKRVERSALPPATIKNFKGKSRPVPAWTEHLPNGVSFPIIETDGDRGHFDNTPEFKVPAGHYFFLGDFRDNSTDSRVSPTKNGPGIIPLEQFVGKAIWISDKK